MKSKVAKIANVLYLTDFPAIPPPMIDTGIDIREGMVDTSNRVLKLIDGKAPPIDAMAGVMVPTPHRNKSE